MIDNLLPEIDLNSEEFTVGINTGTCTANIFEYLDEFNVEDTCSEELTVTVEVFSAGNTYTYEELETLEVGVGNYAVVITVQDESNTVGGIEGEGLEPGSSSLYFVNVRDLSNPEFSACPSDTVIAYLDEDCKFQFPDYLDPAVLGVSDCSSPIQTFNSNSEFTAEDANTIWTHDQTISVLVTSFDGVNSANCAFDINFQDIIAPEKNSENNEELITIELEENCLANVEDYRHHLTYDDCSGIEITQTPEVGLLADYDGIDYIRFTIEDAAGNSVFDSIPAEFKDLILPEVETNNSANHIIEIGSAFGFCDTLITEYENFLIDNDLLVITDNCYSTEELILVSSEILVDSTEFITLSISDELNTITTELQITIEDLSFPNWSDLTQIPDTVFLSTPSDQCEAIFEHAQPDAEDNCHAVEIQSTVNDNLITTNSYAPGDYTFRILATDETDRSIDTSYVLRVLDGSIPIFTDPICSGDTIEFCSPLISYLPDAPINCGEEVNLFQDETDPNQANGEIPFTEIGYHELHYIAEDAAGNSSSCLVNINITTNIIAQIEMPDTNICINETAIPLSELYGLSTQGPDATWWIEDLDSGTPPVPATQIDPSSLGLGTFRLKYRYDNGNQDCYLADSVEFVIHDLPEIILPVIDPLCELAVELPVPESDEADYNWYFEDEVIEPEDGEVVFSPSEQGTYALVLHAEISDSLIGCVNSATLEVSLFEQPTIEAMEDISLDFTTSAILEAIQIGPGESEWTTDGNAIILESDSLETEIEGLTLGENLFTITVTNQVCEVVSDEVLVYVSGFIIPNAFTPNADGENDNFEIDGLYSFTNRKLSAFNRWGKLIYENTNYDNSWNGKNSGGIELPEDTYFYILELDGEVHSGYVIIKR